jgi:3',5'-nucleoside bisphosphate phosphatase
MGKIFETYLLKYYMKIDLHLHSYFSDGVYSPEDLIKKLKEKNFQTVSLTDHNTIDGVAIFMKKAQENGLRALPGVEIYTEYQKKSLHLLGYNFDLKNKKLNQVLKDLQEQKRKNVIKAIKILQEDHWQIQEKDVFTQPASYYGLWHLANVLKENQTNWERMKTELGWIPGQIVPITEIITNYLMKKKNHSLYRGESICPETTMDTVQAIKLINQAGGQSVLAHPGEHLSWRDDDLVAELKKTGLNGIEAISSHHSWQAIEHWQKIGKELGLKITMGSDFHGEVPLEWGFPVSSPWDYFNPIIKKEIDF